MDKPIAMASVVVCALFVFGTAGAATPDALAGQSAEQGQLFSIDVPTLSATAPGDGASAETTYTLVCSGTISGIFGGSQSCSKTYSVGLFSSSVSNSFSITWAFLGSGIQSFKVRDPVGDYIAGGCASPRPAITSSDVACNAVLLRSIVFAGTHTFSVTQNYNQCLNPLTLFACSWGNTDTATVS